MRRLADSWRGRPPGERRLLAGFAIAVAAVLVASLAWLPLERERARLRAEVPALRGSLAALERDAAEARRLKSLAPAAPPAATPLASLATQSGGLAGAQVSVLDARRVRLAGADVGFAGLLEWLRNAQASHGMRVESARIEALPAAGRVKAELLLVRS